MKRILLTQGQFAIVDDKNYEWLNQWKWCATWGNKSFYAVRSSKREKGKRHLISKADHIDHNTLDNRESNLRIVTPQQNKCNRRNVKGFQFDNQANRYQAYIKVNGKVMHLGCFNTPKGARIAYLKAKGLYHKI